MNLLSNTIAAAPDCWMQDRHLDVTGHSNDATTRPSSRRIRRMGLSRTRAWAKLVVAIFRTGSDHDRSVDDRGHAAASCTAPLRGQARARTRSTTTSAPATTWNHWSGLDITLAAGTYWVAVLPKLGAGDIDLADGKYLYLSVRPLDEVSIRVEGQEITDDVEIKSAQFSSQANGVAGSGDLPLSGSSQDRQLRSRLDPDLRCLWRPAVEWVRTNVRRGFYTEGFEALNTAPRFLEVTGADVNVLFPSRQLHSKVAPLGRTELTAFPAGSDDDVILRAYLADFLDIEDDLLTTWGIVHVGTPAPDSALQGLAGESMGSFFNLVSRNLGSVYYIDPERTIRYADTETVTAPFDVSDQPPAPRRGSGRWRSFQTADR